MRMSIIKMKIFVTSDLHLDHKNIIRYCKRPFKNVEEMNKTLVKNWNKTVGKNDVVFFLGDLCFHSEPVKWMSQLNGHIIFIKGNHDIFGRKYHIFKYDGIKFFLTHRLFNVPTYWDGWKIVGHGHNKYPHINWKTKTINSCVEVTNYKPVELKELVRRIKNVEV